MYYNVDDDVNVDGDVDDDGEVDDADGDDGDDDDDNDSGDYESGDDDGGDDDGGDDDDGDGDDGDDDDDDDERKMKMWMARRRKMMKLRRMMSSRTFRKSQFGWKLHGKCRTLIPRPAFCASLRSRNAHGHVTRGILYKNKRENAARVSRDTHFVRACAVEMHMDMCSSLLFMSNTPEIVYYDAFGIAEAHSCWELSANTEQKDQSRNGQGRSEKGRTHYPPFHRN